MSLSLTGLLIRIVFIDLILIGALVPLWWRVRKRNLENIRQLSECGAETILKPDKMRFLFSKFVEFIALLVFSTPIAWIIEDRIPVWFVCYLCFVILVNIPLAYPYYSIAIFKDKLNGPTRHGWLWRRTEIRFDDIDKDKVLRQRLRRKLGISVIYSITGQKIKTVGLDDQQLLELLDLAG